MKQIIVCIMFIILAACAKKVEHNISSSNTTSEHKVLSDELLVSPSSFYIQTKINEKKSFSMYVQNQSNQDERDFIVDLTNDNSGFKIEVNDCRNKTLKPFESCRIEISVQSDKAILNTSRLIVGNAKYTTQSDLLFRSLPSSEALVATNHFEHINQNSKLNFNIKNLIVSGDAINYNIVGDPNNGKVSLDTNTGTLEYTPQNNFVGNDYFSFKAEDIYGNESNVAVFQIIVGKSELVPIAYEQSVAVVDNAPTSFSLLAQDPNNNKLKYTITKQPSKGKITFKDDKYTYIPNQNSSETDLFKFKVNNGSFDSNVADVKITFLNSVEAQNIDSGDDEKQDETFSTVVGVDNLNLNNEKNKDTNNAGGIFITGTNVPTGGLAPTKPVYPGTTVSPTAPPVITISSSDLSLQATEDSTLNIILHSSDSAASFQIINQPQHGTLSGSHPNLVYIPNPDYFGVDSFSYRSSKNGISSNVAQVNINIANVNDLPEASDITFSVKFDEPVPMALQMQDKDNDSLTPDIVSLPQHGTISGSYPNLMYTPNMYYMGTDSFTYKVNDGQGSSEVKTVSINVINTTNNYAPVANNQNITVVEDNVKNINLNVTDINQDNLTYALVQAPQNGTVTFVNGEAIYTPNANYIGADSFTYQANDGQLTSGIATINLTVSAVNDAPSATDLAISLKEDETANVDLVASDIDNDALIYTIVSQPAHGTLSGTIPNLVYTPSAHYNGADSFTFKVNDGTTDSAVKTVSLTITPENDKPIADSNNYNTDENEPVSILLTGSDLDGDSFTFTVVSQPAHGTLSGTVPNLTYTPNANYAGVDSFTFKVNDGNIDSDVQTINVSINNLNFAPVANTLTATTQEDQPVNIILSGTDPDSDALTYTVTNQPLHGTLSGTLPNLVYTPNLNYNGSDSFTYVANDGVLNSPGVIVSIGITPVNDAPIAFDQGISLNEEEAKNISLIGTDVDGDTLTYTIVSQPLHGTISGTVPNLTYTPNADYAGLDNFTFKVNDGTVDSNVATVSLTISNTNDAPVANNIAVTTQEDVNTNIVLTGSDSDNDTLSYIVVSQPAHGTLTGTPPSLTYTPALNYNGADSFTYKVNDGIVDSATVVVSITVTPVNDAPVSQNISTTTAEDTSANIVLLASDVDGNTLTYTIVTQPLHGTISGTLPNLVYTPNANYNGADSFTYKVNDGTLDSNISTVSINVSVLNDAPVAQAQSLTTNEDVALNLTLTATDIDSDPLSYVIVSQPTHGILSGTLPNLVYTPALNYNGADSFTFKANDGTVDSAVVTVSLTVTPVNDAPVAQAQSIAVIEDTAKNITLVATDVENSPLTYTVVSQPTHGIISGTLPNLIYTPTTNYTGADSFTYKANDGAIDSAVVTVSINVSAVNDTPVAQSQSVAVIEDTAKNITLAATDADGDVLTYTMVSAPAHGTLSGTFPNVIYTPALNYNGADSFTFKANDGTVDSNVATVSLTISAVNDAPIATNMNFSTNEDVAYNGTLTASDVDLDTLTYSIVGTPSHGTVTIINLQTGAFVYTPTANYNGSDSFSFMVNDGTLNSNIATVAVNVISVNDAPTSNTASFSTNKNITLNANLTATDADSNPMTFSAVSSTTHGALTINADGSFTYVPTNNYYGSDSFTFRIYDGTAYSTTYTANITVNNTNTAPVAQGLVLNISSDSLPYNGQLIGTDVDGNILTYTIVSGSGVSLNANGSFSYSTASSTTFTYKVNDGTLDSNVATVTINVTLRDNYYKIATNSSLINATISNFPLMIDLQNMNHVEHFWSNVQSDGADILVTLSDKTTKVPVAIRNFNKTDRTGQIWFKASVTANTSTVFYIHYNNDSSQDISMPAASSTYGSNKVWENNYIGYWDMNLNGSTISNAASSNLIMTKTSNPTSLNHGHNDKAVEINTNGLKAEFFTAPYSSEAQLENEVTISAWVYPTKSVKDSIILRKEGTGDKDNYSLRLDKLKPYFTFDNNCGSKSITASQAIPLNRWTHLVGTFNRATTTSRIYVNGALVLEGDPTDHDHDSVGATPIHIGRLNTSATEQFEGYIDEVKLSPNNVSSNWVQLEYNMTNQDNMFWLFDDETVSFAENFNRVNNNAIGNTWTEYEGCAGNANLSVYLLGLLGINITSANTNCGYMRIEHNALDFYSLADSQAFPELTRSLTSLNSGIVNLSFDVNFKKTGVDSDYAFIINFGQSSKSIGELIWGSTNHGLNSDLGFGIVEKSLASIQQIKTINHRETISVVINFTNKTYSVFAKGTGLEDISFEDPTAILSKISFIVSNINSTSIPVVRIDNLIIKHKN